MKERILERLKQTGADTVVSADEYRGELTLVIRRERIHDVCRILKDEPEFAFDSLRDICGADYFRPAERFEVVYNLYSLSRLFRLRLKVRLDEQELHVSSVADIWKTADWHERETFDMFGIRFDGHPDLRRMYMPEEFEHYPLRKDFPLMGIPGSLPLPRS